MKKVFTFLLLTFLFIININADVTMSYDKAVNNSQRYVYKFNKYGKYIITDKKYIEIVNSDTAIIPFAFKNNKSTVNTDFTRGGLLNEEEFIVSKDSNGNTYLSQDVEFFLMKDGTIKAINVLNNDVIDAGDKKYALRVTEFVIPGTKTKGSGTKNNPWEFVGTYKLTFYIENGKITNNNLLVDKYIVYAVESTEGQIVINFKPDSTFAYYNNNCDFEYEYDKTNKIHRIFKPNKDITSDKECTINLIATGLLIQYDLNGGTGNCESLSVTKGSKLTNICTSVSKPGYMFKGWKDASGNIVTKDTIVNDNLKLTAQWEIKKYTLTVKPNGGVWNNQTENKTIEQEYMSTTTIDNPTKGSTYKITFDSNNTNATISKNIVEAERPFNNWKLTKDVNDVTTKLENNKFTFGTSNATIEANYRVNSNNTTLALISKTGHICKWNTKSDGSGTSYTSGYTNYSANSNITLYAICSANSYKVSLDNQGATTAGTSSVSVTYGKNISNITVPAKAYKVTLVYDSTKTEEKTVKLTFGGYYSETNGKGIQYINASGSGVKAYDKASNTTLYAKWNSASITLPTPSKTGYTFDGWYTQSSGGTKVSNTYTPTVNTTLYAHWNANSYTLTINPNGGTWNNTTSNSTKTGTTNSTLSIANPTPPKGYTVSFNTNGGSSLSSITSTKSFSGWSNSGSGSISGTTYTFGAGNGTLTANYKNNSVNLPTPTKSGYTFDGWYTQSSGGTKVSNTYTPTVNTTLYAHWNANSYTLTINPNGGTWNNTTSNSTKTGTTNSTLSIANPTPKGYTVSFNTDGGNNVNSITSQRTFTNWSLSGSGSISGTTYTFGAGNATLTANYNNGSITLPSVSKAGHKFKGWYSNGCSGTFIGNAGESYTPTSNVTLKACYSYYAYILDVYPNGGTWNGTTEKTRIEPLANPKPSIYGNTNYTGKIGSTIDIPNPIPPSGYTVSFDTNGGSSVSSITSTKSFNGWNNSSPGTFSGTTYTYGEGSGYITANYKNNSVNLPTPTKLGYTFGGWYTASSGGTKVNNTYTPTGNITLYAHWSANSYTLSFDANGCGTLRVSYVTATVGKTYGDADDGDGLPSIALTTGKNFDGWYTSSSGGNKITNSTTVTASSDNGTLYAHCSYINYNINYNLANGTHGSSHPTSAKYGDVINISKPSKKVTINLSRGTNASNATISSTSVSAAQTFAGWTATNLNTTTARRGTSSSSVNTQWSSGSTKSTYTYYKNLTVTNNATVKLTANWTQKSVTLPTITKSGYKCGWATSSTATTYTYESGATYVPNANGSSNLTLYGVCKRIAPPSLTVKFTTSAGYTNTCTSTYTTTHGSCTFDDGYYAPLSLSIVATDTNEVTNMKLEYNKPGQTSYTDITGSYELSPTKSGNTYTATTSIGSTGKRKLRITATNNQGKTGTVILNINIIPQTFAAQNNCSDKTLTADGNIFVWKGESSCTNASKSPCGQMQADTLGLISKGAELCYVKTISSSSNVIFIAAWIEESQFSHKGGVLTKGYPGYGTATTKTFNGKTYYYSKLVAWCNNASCDYGWVIKPEI